jgi:ATP-dependent Lon protease
VATGLAWTAAGGDLTTVEVMAVPGHGAITLTGQLGDVMKESAQAALTFTRSRACALGLPETLFERRDIHVHLPAGAIPKDGPSAGVTMAVAMISALTDRAIRRDVAMTGEITLRGRVMPVGGVKEKALAAYRAGVTTVILPRRNLRDLDDVAPDIHERMTFVPVDTMDDVLALALLPAQSSLPGPLSREARGSQSRTSLPGPLSHEERGNSTGRVVVSRTPTRVARPRSRRAVAVAGA